MVKRARPARTDFWRNGLSVSESKFSVLVLAFLVLTAISVYMFVTKGDISANQLDLIRTIIYAIAGINIAQGIRRVASVENENDELDQKSEREAM